MRGSGIVYERIGRGRRFVAGMQRLQTRCPAGARKKGGDRIEVATLLSIGDVQLNAL